MEETWIKDDARYPRAQWSVFNKAIRTNNDTEGWHTRLNTDADKIKIPMYRLINTLSEEQETADMEIKLVSAGKLKRYQKKAFREKQAKIFGYWKRYTDDDTFTAIDLLTAVSKVKIAVFIDDTDEQP